NADVAGGNGRAREGEGDSAAVRIHDFAGVKSFPLPIGTFVEIESVSANPVLDFVGFRIGRHPLDASYVDLFFRLKVDDYPLGMKCVRLSGESAGEIRIAFPVEKIGALYGAVAAGGKAAVWKRVGKNITNGCFEFDAAGEVAALVCGIAPRSSGIPVPGRHSEFRIVAISNGPPSGGESFLDDVGSVDAIDVAARENVE